MTQNSGSAHPSTPQNIGANGSINSSTLAIFNNLINSTGFTKTKTTTHKQAKNYQSVLSRQKFSRAKSGSVNDLKKKMKHKVKKQAYFPASEVFNTTDGVKRSQRAVREPPTAHVYISTQTKKESQEDELQSLKNRVENTLLAY